jgi:hypothetical protein
MRFFDVSVSAVPFNLLVVSDEISCTLFPSSCGLVRYLVKVQVHVTAPRNYGGTPPPQKKERPDHFIVDNA